LTTAITIAQTIQLAVAPVFLLAGIGGILSVLATRLARAVDRSRELARLHPSSMGVEHDRHVEELRVLDRRISLANLANTLCAISALTVCLVIILLFVSQLARLDLSNVIALLFVIAMLLLSGGIIAFLAEIRVAIDSLRVRQDLLER
jgi:hypothetical protein